MVLWAASGSADAAQGPTRVLSIGGIDSPSGDWFQRVGDISIAQNGWICVADSGRLEILCYSADGKLQSSMGGEGDGPGELRALSAVEADTVVVAWDPITGRATRYSLDGRVAGSERTRPSGFDAGTARRLRNGSLVIVTAARFAHGELYDPYIRLVLSRPESTDTIAAVRTSGALWYDAADGMPYGAASTPFGAGGAWSFVGDSALVVADGYSGELTWYKATATGLAVARRAEVPVEARPVSDQDMADFKKSLRAERGDAVPREVALRGPPSWSGITGLVVADGGDVVYIGSPDGDGRTSWRALRSDDGLAVVPLPPAFKLKAVSDGVFYGVVTDELDVQRVVGLRVAVQQPRSFVSGGQEAVERSGHWLPDPAPSISDRGPHQDAFALEVQRPLLHRCGWHRGRAAFGHQADFDGRLSLVGDDHRLATAHPLDDRRKPSPGLRVE